MRILTISALILGVSGLASADRLMLRNGAVVQGTYLGGTARQVRMDVNGRLQTFEIDQVRSISFNDEGGGPPAPPPPPTSDSRFDRDGGANRDRDGGAYRGQNYPGPGGPLGITLPADTRSTVRMIDAVNSQTARRGQTFRASLDEPIVVGDRQVVPRGADVITKLVEDQQSGKFEGRTVLTMALVSINIDGRLVDVTTTDVRTESASRGNRTAGVVGGGAAVGAIIGALAGGGKGAAIGAASGGALGGATEILTSGQQVRIPSETRLSFRLQVPVQI